MNTTQLKGLVQNIRSPEKSERAIVISQIPFLILESFRDTDAGEQLDQLLLVIYNLNIESQPYEYLNAGNKTPVIRQLLRLYTETIGQHDHKQISALAKLIDYANSSELLVELAHALHRCMSTSNEEDTIVVEEALGAIREKAAISLFPEALLMIHTIMPMK